GGKTEVTMRRVLVERAREDGIYMRGAAVTMEDVHIRDTLDGPGGQGYGMEVLYGAKGTRGTLQANRVVLERNYYASAGVAASDATFERSVFRGMDQAVPAGFGIISLLAPTLEPQNRRATVTLRQSVVQDAQGMAVAAQGSDMILESTVVRDTHRRGS